MKRFKKILESKKTTAIALIILILPFAIFGFILLRDSSQTGEPVIGSRYDEQLDSEITSEQINLIENNVVDERVIYKKVILKASTLRVYLEVDAEESKESIQELANTSYEKVVEVLPVETYFVLQGKNKNYDLEVHVYNNIEDRESDEFHYYQITKSSSMETLAGEFVSDTRDPDFKEEVLENLAEKEAGTAEDVEETEGTEEDDTGGE